MPAIITNKMRLSSAAAFKDSFSNSNNNIYLFIGNSSPWTNDNLPPLPVDNVDINNSIYREMLALKKIGVTDVSLVIPGYKWISGNVYSQYSHLVNVFNPSISTPPFYVVTDEMNVYKCLYNNSAAASTIKPTGTSTNVFQTSDGYKWKFMYQVASADVIKFTTDTWIPVKTISSNDSSLQWAVQQAAVPGAIDRIDLVTVGTNYTTNPTVVINGDGTGAVATATVSGGGVATITVTNSGAGYTYADISFTGGGVGAAGATAQAIISPILGHGADAVYELSGRYVMVNVNLAADEGGVFTVGNDYRRLGLLKNPILNSTNLVATGAAYTQTSSLTFGTVTGGDFVADDTVTGLTSGATAKVVDYDDINLKLSISNVIGSFHPGETVQNSGATVAGGLVTYNGTLQNASSTTVQFPVGASSVNDFYKNFQIKITSGPGAGQIRTITGYVGSTRVATVDTAFGSVPNNTSVFAVAPIYGPALKLYTGDLLYVENRRPIPRDPDQSETLKIIMAY